MKINYKKIINTLTLTLVICLVAFFVLIIGTIIWMRWGYYDERDQIKDDLNNIEGVKVINIWGHEDITLEEVSARIRIHNKGEIVLHNLNKNDNWFPDFVYISEIGGYSFHHFSCTCFSGSVGTGPSLNIGTKSFIGELIDLKFDNAKTVIDNYDKIFTVIDSVAKTANPLHITPQGKEIDMLTFEEFVFFEKKSSKDQDPIFNLLDAEGDFNAAKNLPWVRDSCCKE